jgi:hypothetical protein
MSGGEAKQDKELDVTFDVVDIAPTLCRWLGEAFDAMEGRSIYTRITV